MEDWEAVEGAVDERPGTRDQASFLFRYRHHLEDIAASAHADYRLYVDDWGVVSHTVELAWYQNFMDWLTVTPGFRWYTQSKADFYEPVLPSANFDERTSDYRLSPYGAISAKLKIDAEVIDAFQYAPPPWLEAIGVSEGFDLIASLSYERYWSDGAFSLGDVENDEEAPALVGYHVIALTLSGRF